MQLLTVSALLHRIHHDVFRSHKRQFAHQALLNDLGIYHKAVHYIQAQIQDAVHSQEAFRYAEAFIGRIIQGSFEPLGRRGNGGIKRIRNHISGKGGDTFAAHGVSLIGHGGRTDLALFKRLFHFL